MTASTKPHKLSPDEQKKLNDHLFDAANQGDTEAVRTLLVAGANVHADGDKALYFAVFNNHTETMKALLASGADAHAGNDNALYWATENDHMETVEVLARHIFAPDSWRGKNRAAIEAQANALYDRMKVDIFLHPIKPEHLRKTGTILFDRAMKCWEQVRPAPPKIKISPLPAQPRPV